MFTGYQTLFFLPFQFEFPFFLSLVGRDNCIKHIVFCSSILILIEFMDTINTLNTGHIELKNKNKSVAYLTSI